MRRRKFLVGAGSLAAGSAAAVGTGAFTSVEANRSINVDVEGDKDAFLKLWAPDALENDEYAEVNDSGELELQFNDDADSHGGSGVNPDSLSYFDEVFRVTNHGTQKVQLYIDDEDISHPDRIRFYVLKNRSGTIRRETIENGSDEHKPEYPSTGGGQVPLELGVGKSQEVGVMIDTRGSGWGDGDSFGGEVTIVAKERGFNDPNSQ